jgi:hypothetical protein
MTQFKDFFLRPNLGSTGTIPAQGSITQCPDIWLAGTEAISDPATTLASDKSYAKASSSDVVLNADNYIYLRGKNGADNTVSKRMELYYAPCGVINWPSKWVENKLKTGDGSDYVEVNNVASGNVAAGNKAFIWKNVTRPPQGSDHYCIFANVNDAQNSHPVPGSSGFGKINMAEVVKNDLCLGWRNIHLVDKGIDMTFHTSIEIDNAPGAGGTYNLYLKCPKEFNGTSVAFSANKADSHGGKIELFKTKVEAGDVPAIYGVEVELDQGFNAQIQINLWFNGVNVPSGYEITMEAGFQTTDEEHQIALDKNLYNPDYHEMLKANEKTFGLANGIPVHRTLFIGSDHYRMK